jgi:hypothetical protein
MPSRPRWYADIDRIRDVVRALPSPFLDRPTIERLFSVRSRQANYLMRSLGGYRVGQAAVVSRDDLLDWLDTASGAERVTAQVRRKSRVLEALDALRSEARPQRIAAPPALRPDSPLPEGVCISASGELTIRFNSAEDLLGRIMGLAQSAAADFVSFTAALEPERLPAPSGYVTRGDHQGEEARRP